MSLDIIGHGDILRAFDHLIDADRLGHAYLFVGPEGVGKSTVASWVASRLLCGRQATHGEAGSCDVCAAIARGSHPDVLVLRGDDVRSVERVREWASSLAQSSLFAGWKVGIVEGAEQMSEAGANACLKTIEEPTPKTVIFLTCPSRRSVLPTIASRCAIIPCARVPNTVLAKELRAHHQIAPEEVDALVTLADGCPGRAIAYHADADLRERSAEHRAFARAAMTESYADRLRHVETFSRDLPSERARACEQTMGLVQAFRDVGRDAILPRSLTPQSIAWLRLLVRAPHYLHANVAPRLLLETIAMTYPADL